MIRIRVMRRRRFDTSLPHITIGLRWVAAVPQIGSELMLNEDDSREVEEVYLKTFHDPEPDPAGPVAEVWVR